MSGAAQAREKPDRHGLEKPNAPAGTPLYSAVPRAVGSYAEPHTAIQDKILELLKSPKYGGERREDFSFSNKQAPSCAKMAEILKVDHTTISRNMHELSAKRSLQVKPIMSGGRRMGTEYFVYCYDDALKARRNAADIARRDDGKFLIIGRGKHFMTPAAATLWGIKLYSGGAEEQATAARDAATPLTPKTELEMEHLVIAAVGKAVRDGTKGVSKEMLQEYIRQAQATATSRNPPVVITTEQIVAAVRETRKLAKNQHIGNPQYFLQTVKQRVNALLDAMEDERNAAAEREAQKAWVPRPDCPICGGTGERLVSVSVRGIGATERVACECFAEAVSVTKAVG
jgi:hypothetical protein